MQKSDEFEGTIPERRGMWFSTCSSTWAGDSKANLEEIEGEEPVGS